MEEGNDEGKSEFTQSQDHDRQVLVELFRSMGGPNWNTALNWLSDKPLQEWYGISTDESGRVEKIDLFGNNLTNSLPQSFGRLSNLRVLHINNNKITGEIPESFGSLNKLSKLLLDHNRFNGGFEHVRHLAGLAWLTVDRNFCDAFELPTAIRGRIEQGMMGSMLLHGPNVQIVLGYLRESFEAAEEPLL